MTKPDEPTTYEELRAASNRWLGRERETEAQAEGRRHKTERAVPLAAVAADRTIFDYDPEQFVPRAHISATWYEAHYGAEHLEELAALLRGFALTQHEEIERRRRLGVQASNEEFVAWMESVSGAVEEHPVTEIPSQLAKGDLWAIEAADHGMEPGGRHLLWTATNAVVRHLELYLYEMNLHLIVYRQGRFISQWCHRCGYQHPESPPRLP